MYGFNPSTPQCELTQFFRLDSACNCAALLVPRVTGPTPALARSKLISSSMYCLYSKCRKCGGIYVGVGGGGGGGGGGRGGGGKGGGAVGGTGVGRGVTVNTRMAGREGVGVGAATARAFEGGFVGTGSGCTGATGATDALGFSPHAPTRPSNSSSPTTQPPAAASAISNSKSRKRPRPPPLWWSLCQPCRAILLRRPPLSCRLLSAVSQARLGRHLTSNAGSATSFRVGISSPVSRQKTTVYTPGECANRPRSTEKLSNLSVSYHSLATTTSDGWPA